MIVTLANRSFCHLKLECCRAAIQDATKAIQLDPTYAKGYLSSLAFIFSFYRRASAYFYSGKLQEALDDFKQCLAVNPNNR